MGMLLWLRNSALFVTSVPVPVFHRIHATPWIIREKKINKSVHYFHGVCESQLLLSDEQVIHELFSSLALVEDVKAFILSDKAGLKNWQLIKLHVAS